MGTVIPLRQSYSDTSAAYEDDFSLDEVIKQNTSQQKLIIELLQKLSEKQNTVGSATWTVNPNLPMPSYKFLAPTIEPGIFLKSLELTSTSQQPKSIPLHLLLELGSLVAGAISIGSIAVWISGYVPLINPFASMLILLASPFFFVMGKISRNIN